MRLLSRLTVVLSLLPLALIAIAESPRAAETPIRALFTQMTEAWNRGDTAGVGAVFKQDVNATPSRVDFAKADVAILTAYGGFQRPDEATVSAAQQGIQTLVAVREGRVWRVVLFQRTRLSTNASR